MQEHRRNVFWMLQTGALIALPGPGKKCRKVMHAMDAAFAKPETAAASLDGKFAETAKEARTILRLRCALCSSRCKGPLV